MIGHLRTALAIAVIASAAHAEDTVTLHEYPFLRGNYEVIQNGQRTGSVRERPFQPDQYEVFDRDGRRVGTIRHEPFSGEIQHENNPETE